MKRLALLFVLGCGGGKDTASKGPSYSPSVANQLATLAPDCETKPGTGGVHEVRTCRGNNASTTISLDSRRHLVALAIELHAWALKIAHVKLDPALAGLGTPAAITAISDGLMKPVNEGTIDGVKFKTTKTAGELAHYTLSLAW